MDNMREMGALLSEIRQRACEGEPVGGLIETYIESALVVSGKGSIEITPVAQEVFEAALKSKRLADRDAALEALVHWGNRIGYEADALLLHHQSKPEVIIDISSAHYLGEMAYNGSAAAARILYLLTFDRDWMENHFSDAFSHEDSYTLNLAEVDEPTIERIRAFWLGKITRSH